MLLHDSLAPAVAASPGKVALVTESGRYTYAEVDARARALAAFLQSRGLRRGERVAIFLENDIEAVTGIYAALMAGAVFMPVNPLTKRDKLAYLLDDARAAVLLTHAALAPVVEGVLERNRHLRTCLVAGAPKSPFADARARAWPAPDVEARPEDPGTIDQDLAGIIYTSGSTGDPKGVMLSHLNMVSAARSITTYLGQQASDVILCALPLAFDYGLYQVLMGFGCGATVVLERGFAFPVRILEVMVREHVSVLPGVPTLFSLLMNLKTLASHDLGSLRLITNTAAALTEQHVRELRALFPQARLYSMYGLTECKRVTYLPPEQLDVRPTSVGRGMPNEEVWLVDENGNRLPNGSTGELVVRGSHVMRGYWEKPEATAERLKPGPIPGESVLYTGDLFRTDSEGYLYFVARKDDIIKSRGEKVSPAEVENALYAHEAVLEAAVIGVPDDVLGEAVKAYVVLKPGRQASEREIIRHCLGRLENFMAPKVVEFVASLPKTTTGKIRKNGLDRAA